MDINIIEDHDQALAVWRKRGVKNLDLVHIDAHMDFGFCPAKPIKEVFSQAKSLRELKRNLEYSLAFTRYEKNFDKQTNIGNYIYPAIQEGIVKNFYWVIPGELKEFKMSLKIVKNSLKNFIKKENKKSLIVKDGWASAEILGRKFIVCVLDKLPFLEQPILLDIDTDFLVVDSLLNANNTIKIGKRRPWILPQELVNILKDKVRRPVVTTIAYSVNGGYTPMKYKHLGDEIAYYFFPEKFKKRYSINTKAAEYFNLFYSTGKKEYYRKAVEINSGYRAEDNNYGPLYLSLRKFILAEKEFLKILRVDPKNPASLWGVGNIALERKDFKKAKKYFSLPLNLTKDSLFSKAQKESMFGLAKTEFNLKNFNKAKKLLLRYCALEPLQAQSYYFLGHVFEYEEKYDDAAGFYKDAIRTGYSNLEVLSRLFKVLPYLKNKFELIQYISDRYQEFKKGFLKTKRLRQKKNGRDRGLYKIEKKMMIIEEKLRILYPRFSAS
ncbi:MAG: UPF0489 family protein [Candidatus Omnitrophota bacterium]